MNANFESLKFIRFFQNFKIEIWKILERIHTSVLIIFTIIFCTKICYLHYFWKVKTFQNFLNLKFDFTDRIFM